VKNIYSNLCYNISHKSLYLVLAFATHKSSHIKMNSNLHAQNLRSKGFYTKLLQSITEQLFIISKRCVNINFKARVIKSTLIILLYIDYNSIVVLHILLFSIMLSLLYLYIIIHFIIIIIFILLSFIYIYIISFSI